MNITFRCPHCEASARVELAADQSSLFCPACQREIRFPDQALDASGVHRCLVCPSVDLYCRKDFPQRVGVTLVAIGIIGSSIAWYYAQVYWTFGILFATALADVVLYTLVGEALMCYRCQAQYRGLANLTEHGPFHLEVHERHRQATARERDLATAATAAAAATATTAAARRPERESPPVADVRS